ncbi:MAG TPA: sulfotransferase domain-containing protein [Terriglobia bacterium]|nr:sulfotransferase domain-containing protein [Terriglobia bacterium]
MLEQSLAYPQKTRDIHNHHFDSTVWNDLKFRDDDIVIATYGKSGTTWTQQIVGQLIFNGAEDVPVPEMSPWIDLRVPAKEVKLAALEAQTHRRFMKTHLPVDALVFSPKARYLYIGRDGRDVVWSLYNHHSRANQLFYDTLNDAPGRVGPPLERTPATVRQYYDDWMAKDGDPLGPFWPNSRSWWAIRHLPNVQFMHFADMKRDLPTAIRRIADFLEIEVEAAKWPDIITHCSFAYMKAHAASCTPRGGALWEGGAETFIHRGTNGRWRDTLSAEGCAAYEARAVAELGEDCARWLAEGAACRERPAGRDMKPRCRRRAGTRRARRCAGA